MSTTRGCPSCGREADFHAVSCCFERTDDGLRPIRELTVKLLAAVRVWADDHRRGPWAGQLVAAVKWVSNTVDWLTKDIAESVEDERKKQEERRDA